MNWDALSTVIILVTAIVVYYQLREMRRATVATAFSSIAEFLQSKEVRDARGVLMRISEEDFTKWKDNEKESAEVACSTYDVIGIILQQEVIDHKMVTLPWRDSIVRCWEKAQPMIKFYRKERGEDFWKGFQGLYEKCEQAAMVHSEPA